MLQLIDKQITYEDMALLVKWRKANELSYKEQPEITMSSMVEWLENHVFNKNRLLFWVIINGKKIGHMGLFHFEKDSCELDGVLRGEPDYPGAIGKDLDTLISMALKLKPKLYLRILTTNFHAYNFYLLHKFIPMGKEDVYIKMKYES